MILAIILYLSGCMLMAAWHADNGTRWNWRMRAAVPLWFLAAFAIFVLWIGATIRHITFPETIR